MLALLAGEGRAPSGETLELSELTVAGAGARAAERPRLLRLRGPRRRRRAAARPRDRPVLVRGARLLLLEPGCDPRPGRAGRPPGGDGDARLRARDRGRDRPRRRRRARDRRLHADERLVGARRAAGEVTVGLGPAKAKDFATSVGPWIVTPDELPLRGRAARGPGAGARQRRRDRRRTTPPSSTSAGPRSSPTPRATPACDPATCSARARSPAAACSSSGRWSRRVGESRAGSSPATWSRSRPTGLGRLETPVGLVGLEHAGARTASRAPPGSGCGSRPGCRGPARAPPRDAGCRRRGGGGSRSGPRRSCRPPRPRGARRPRRGSPRPTSAPRRRARRTRACSSRSPTGSTFAE